MEFKETVSGKSFKQFYLVTNNDKDIPKGNHHILLLEGGSPNKKDKIIWLIFLIKSHLLLDLKVHKSYVNFIAACGVSGLFLWDLQTKNCFIQNLFGFSKYIFMNTLFRYVIWIDKHKQNGASHESDQPFENPMWIEINNEYLVYLYTQTIFFYLPN